MSEMQQQQAFQQQEYARNQAQNQTPHRPTGTASTTQKKDDYIEFEEVKE